jgi:hypothetical protein
MPYVQASRPGALVAVKENTLLLPACDSINTIHSQPQQERQREGSGRYSWRRHSRLQWSRIFQAESSDGDRWIRDLLALLPYTGSRNPCLIPSAAAMLAVSMDEIQSEDMTRTP